MIKTGLYFGTFNPIHIGHLVIANYMIEFTDIENLWFVVSPQNPHKVKQNLLQDYHRYEMVMRAIEDDDRFRTTNIEFRLPKPSYTIDTLTYLKEQYPTREFILLMGSDNLESFHKWKNADIILSEHRIIVYPRPGFNPENVQMHPHIQITDAPLMEISSSFIRDAVKMKKDVRHYLPPAVAKYMEEMHFYEK